MAYNKKKDSKFPKVQKLDTLNLLEMTQDIYCVLGEQPSRHLFYMGAILDVYRHKNGLFGFTCYEEAGMLQVYNGRPIYASPMIALREAKKYYILSNVSADTKNTTVVCDMTTDCVMAQSKLAIKLIGDVVGIEIRQLYANESDRDKIRQLVQREDCYSTLTHVKTLDGIIEANVSFNLIAIDEETKLTVEQLDVVRRFL